MSVWPQVEESFQAFMASGGSGFHYRCAYCRTDYTTEPALFDHVENFHRVPAPIYRADHPEYRVLDAALLGDTGVVVDGRNWVQELPAGVRRVIIGRGERSGSDRDSAGSVGSVA